MFPELVEERLTTIPGLSYIPGYITSAEENHLLTAIDQQIWMTDLKRRVQHYGYRYDYKRRSVDADLYLGALPAWLHGWAQRLQQDGHFAHALDQVIINEYLPGQGIADHVDCVPCFGDTILSLSLGSPCVMMFTRVEDGLQVPLLIEARSLLVMRGEARYEWKHGIPSRKTDAYNGQVYLRARRVSMTFRGVILADAGAS